jgi:hypothetical protein
MRDQSRKGMDRREFLRAGLTTTVALPVAGVVLGARTARAEELVTEVEAMKPTVAALQYVHKSTKPDQSCSNCQFFTAASEEGRGKCQLFPQGQVESTGWCMSWTKKVT